MHRSALPPSIESGPFTYRQGLDAGATRSRLRARDLRVPHHGVRSAVESPGAVGRARELWPVLADDEFFAHLTALELWGLPVPRHLENGPLHVGGTSTRQRRRPGIRGHRYADGTPVTVFHGVRLSTPLEAWLQAAPVLGLDDAIRLGDALAGRWSPWTVAREVEIERLARTVERARRRPGVATLRRALELVRPGVESPKETELRLLIVRAGLPEPEVNVRRFDAGGSPLGRPDLSYGWCRLAFEYQGDHHRTDRATWRLDLSRRERFEDAGWRVVLVSDDDLHGVAASALLARIRRHVAAHRRRAGTL